MIPKEHLTWEEIQTRFHDEWVLLTDWESRRENEVSVLTKARVVAHHSDFQKIFELHRGISTDETIYAFSGWERAELTAH